MKVKYYKKDDLLVIELSRKPFDDAEMEGDFIVHYSKDKEPVSIEVLNASKFLKATSKAVGTKQLTV
ncbi:DUF2283 domain-containing protein [Candidatus Microgenomates bacterium]|nr:DUF2283 domain-containing protein [Candidatus Microgenomates bacterium]